MYMQKAVWKGVIQLILVGVHWNEALFLADVVMSRLLIANRQESHEEDWYAKACTHDSMMMWHEGWMHSMCAAPDVASEHFMLQLPYPATVPLVASFADDVRRCAWIA